MSASRKELLNALRAMVENPPPGPQASNGEERYRRWAEAFDAAVALVANEEDWMDEHYAKQARDAEDEGRW